MMLHLLATSRDREAKVKCSFLKTRAFDTNLLKRSMYVSKYLAFGFFR